MHNNNQFITTRVNNKLLDNGGLLADVDTVKELSDVLVLNGCRLLDGGGGLGHDLDIVSVENDLVLDVRGHHNADTIGDLDLADDLLSEEVTDLKCGKILYFE